MSRQTKHHFLREDPPQRGNGRRHFEVCVCVCVCVRVCVCVWHVSTCACVGAVHAQRSDVCMQGMDDVMMT